MTNEANKERTFIMIKPDGVQRGLVGDIIKRFEQKGFRLVAMKFMHVSLLSSIPRVAAASAKSSSVSKWQKDFRSDLECTLML